MAVWVTRGGISIEATAFLKKVRAACDGRLPGVFVDMGTWYPWALNKTRFKRYNIVFFGHRSAIERFFGDLECGIRRFWNGFVGNYNIKSVQLWIEAINYGMAGPSLRGSEIVSNILKES